MAPLAQEVITPHEGKRAQRVRQPDNWTLGQRLLYSSAYADHASRLDVMNRLGRAMADPTRSRILMSPA